MNRLRHTFQQSDCPLIHQSIHPLIQFLVLLACLLGLAGCTKQSDITDSSSAPRREKPEPPKLSAKDHEFVNHAARANLAEVQIAQLAAERAKSQAVKDFSQRLVKDHAEARQRLEQIAVKRGVMLPDGLTDEQNAVVRHLRPLQGQQFDQAFQKHAVKDHQKNIETFRDAAKKSDDTEVKSYAEKVLPVLQQHLEAARALESLQPTGR